MTNHGDSPENCVISFQLLQLLNWLCENEQETVRKLVIRAVQRSDAFTHLDAQKSDEELEQSLENFFMLLEVFLVDAQGDRTIKKGLQRSLIPALDQIDVAACDDNLVALSAESTTAAMAKNPYVDPKKVLCRELLKRWKPLKDLVKH